MSTRARRLRGPISFWALAGVALLVSHDAVYFAQLGPGEMLTRTLRTAGHDYWGAASQALVAIGLSAAVVIAIQLLRLRAEARTLHARPVGPAPWRRRLLVTWLRLFVLVGAGFVIQESAEHLAMHGHAIGMDALVGPEYPLAIPVLAAITLVAAIVATVLSTAEVALVASIAAARRRVRRAPRRIQRAALRLAGPSIAILARAAAGRAPPRTLVAAI